MKRVALVTGGSGGIGCGIAEALARAGHSVVVGFASNRAGAHRLVARLAADGALASALLIDLCSEQSIREAAAKLEDAGEHVEVLVNNAGVTPVIPLLELTSERWDQVHAVNVRGAFILTREIAARMVQRETRGRIINVTSVNALMSAPGHAAYDASKSALGAFTRSAALDLAPHGITVNAVAPGLVDVPRTRARPGYERDAVGRCFPVGRVGTPADVASAVLYLVSAGAEYVTGQTLVVDGGLLARLP
jgi:NAD(P)-dependent dehydrogenase (short-subunit alcohol dehydrogenase family)